MSWAMAITARARNRLGSGASLAVVSVSGGVCTVVAIERLRGGYDTERFLRLPTIRNGRSVCKGVFDVTSATTTTGGPSTQRPMRADARRNIERVLQAAEEAFATEGLVVPIDEIAGRAGVGVGTVYRHFPTKQALFNAVVMVRLEGPGGEGQAAQRGSGPRRGHVHLRGRAGRPGREKKRPDRRSGPGRARRRDPRRHQGRAPKGVRHPVAAGAAGRCRSFRRRVDRYHGPAHGHLPVRGAGTAAARPRTAWSA